MFVPIGFLQGSELPLSDSLQGSESCIDVTFLQSSELSLLCFLQGSELSLPDSLQGSDLCIDVTFLQDSELSLLGFLQECLELESFSVGPGPCDFFIGLFHLQNDKWMTYS